MGWRLHCLNALAGIHLLLTIYRLTDSATLHHGLNALAGIHLLLTQPPMDEQE